MLKVEHIAKDYGRVKPVRDLSFSLERGEVLGLLGANGAGKSTTLNMLSAYFPPSEGRITLQGFDAAEAPLEYKRRLGYLPEFPPLYPDMTVEEQLELVCSVREIPRRKRKAEVDRVCAMSRIGDVKRRLVKTMSKGYRQRIGLAQALVGDPDLLILDEPVSGLDPRQIIDIRELIRDLGREHGVIISSHILSEIASVSTRVLVLNDGVIAADSPASDLMKSSEGDRLLELRISAADEGLFRRTLAGLDGVAEIRSAAAAEADCLDCLIRPSTDRDLRRKVSLALGRAGCPVLQMKMKNPTLEEIFLELTAGREER